MSTSQPVVVRGAVTPFVAGMAYRAKAGKSRAAEVPAVAWAQVSSQDERAALNFDASNIPDQVIPRYDVVEKEPVRAFPSKAAWSAMFPSELIFQDLNLEI